MSTAHIDLIYSVTDANNPLILIFTIEERVILSITSANSSNDKAVLKCRAVWCFIVSSNFK